MTEDGLEFRRASRVAEVRYPKRMIELIVMPYETETLIGENGKVFTEICSRGAFAGIESRNDRVRVNREHDPKETIGRAVAFHSSRQEGLVAEVRIVDNADGDKALTLAAEDCLDASAAFRPMLDKQGRTVPNATVWETRSRRRLNHLYLGHIALVAEPAYPTANVLAVRQDAVTAAQVPETPNLDRFRIRELQEQYARLNAKYA